MLRATHVVTGESFTTKIYVEWQWLDQEEQRRVQVTVYTWQAKPEQILHDETRRQRSQVRADIRSEKASGQRSQVRASFRSELRKHRVLKHLSNFVWPHVWIGLRKNSKNWIWLDYEWTGLETTWSVVIWCFINKTELNDFKWLYSCKKYSCNTQKPQRGQMSMCPFMLAATVQTRFYNMEPVLEPSAREVSSSHTDQLKRIRGSLMM